MKERNVHLCTRAIIAGNCCIWFSSIVILGLSVGALTYDVDSWLPFDFEPVLQTHDVATASVIISTFSLHLAALGWIMLGFRRLWQIKVYMMGNAVSSLLQMAIGIGVLVVNKEAWPYFQLISLHLCFERYNRQRGRRVVRSITSTSNNNNVTTESKEDDTPLEGWFPSGPPDDDQLDEEDDNDGFFNGLKGLPTRPGPSVPAECLPTDLLTAAGALLVITSVICVFLVLCSYLLWRHQRCNCAPMRENQRGNTFSVEDPEREVPSTDNGHPDKPPRHGTKSQEDPPNDL